MAKESHLDLKCGKNCFADRTAQKQQQTWESDNTVRHGLY